MVRGSSILSIILLLLFVQHIESHVKKECYCKCDCGNKNAQSPGQIQVGLMGQINAGSSGKIHAGSSGKIHAGSAGQKHAGSSGQIHAGSTGQIHAGSTGQMHAGSTGQIHAGATGQKHAESTGQINAGSTGQIHAGSSGQIHAGSSGQIHAGSTGQINAGSTGQIHAGSSGQIHSGLTGQKHAESTGKINAGSTGQIHAGSMGQLNAESTGRIFDVTNYGAKADGSSDMTQCFLSAWKAACASPVPCTLLIPKGVFAMNAVKLQGPCKSPLEFRLQGTLKAPAKVADMNKADGWITMSNIDGLTLTGGGVLDGQGALAWSGNSQSSTLPINLKLNCVNNSIIQGVTTKDSKNIHVDVSGSSNLTFNQLTVSTQEGSSNTDGIHLSGSSGIKILNSNIQSGSDCVSVGEGIHQCLVEKVLCGLGHGFSIGGLGKTTGEADVDGVTFRNCSLTGTQYGVAIKSWPSSSLNHDCAIKNIIIEDIIMNNVQNPVLIDQEHCPSNTCDKKNPSRVKISGVSIKNIMGTFTSQEAVKFICSAGFPCDQVEVGDINLKYAGTAATGKPISLCHHIRPSLIGRQIPPLCTSPLKPFFHRLMN